MRLQFIELERLISHPVAMGGVDLESVEYKELLESIRRHGLIVPLAVRRMGAFTKTEQEVRYAVFDGFRRWAVLKELGCETAACLVHICEDACVLELQMALNIQQIGPTNLQIYHQIWRIIAIYPEIKLEELAARTSISVERLLETTIFKYILPPILEAIRSGHICVANGHVLGKLAKYSEHEAMRLYKEATILSPSEFVPKANAKMKELRDERRQGFVNHKTKDI